MRDYVSWHQAYDDPDSGLSWRLAMVRRYLTQALDRHPGPIRMLSLCAGDGRDIIGVLSSRTDTDRVRAVLVELHPDLGHAARAASTAAGLDGRVEVRTQDASTPTAYADAIPAEIVLLVGIFGNISGEDLGRMIECAPALCAPGATLVWSRGRDGTDLNDVIRSRFRAVGFTELSYHAWDGDDRTALGAVRYDGPGQEMPIGTRLFSSFR